MVQLKKETIDFLKILKSNNNREWFNDNKNLFIDAKNDFENFIEALLINISKFDSTINGIKAKDCIFRIYRDVRFSNDKSPYKTHFGAHISSNIKKSEIHSKAGYYFHLEPNGKTMLAGGAYLPDSIWLKAIRQEIVYNTIEFKNIINSKEFTETFGEIEGEKLKRNPKDYPIDHPEIELLKHKSFLAVNYCSDNILSSHELIDYSTKTFKTLHPFNSFLNRSMD